MPLKATINEIHAEIDRWFAEQIQRSPISRDVAVYNQAHKAYEDLKQRLEKLLCCESGEASPALKKTTTPAT